MFYFFGDDTSLVVKYYIDETRKYGPKYPDCHISEMTHREAEEAYVHTRMAYRLAEREGASEEVLEALGSEVLETFRYVAAFSDILVDSVNNGRFQPVGAKIGKFKEIIQEVRHPSTADAA